MSLKTLLAPRFHDRLWRTRLSAQPLGEPNWQDGRIPLRIRERTLSEHAYEIMFESQNSHEQDSFNPALLPRPDTAYFGPSNVAACAVGTLTHLDTQALLVSVTSDFTRFFDKAVVIEPTGSYSLYLSDGTCLYGYACALDVAASVARLVPGRPVYAAYFAWDVVKTRWTLEQNLGRIQPRPDKLAV